MSERPLNERPAARPIKQTPEEAKEAMAPEPISKPSFSSQLSHSNSKSLTTAVFLSILIGFYGVDHFYLGKTRSGLIKLVTLGGLGIWWIVDIVALLRGKTVDAKGDPLNGDLAKVRKTSLLFFTALILASLTIQFGYRTITGDWSTPSPTSSPSSHSSHSSVSPTAPTNTNSDRISSESCLVISTNVTMVETALREANLNPPQFIALLEKASIDWTNESYKYKGSKSEWLAKMAELATKLGSYITTGSPSNGPLIANQLQNNMALVDQFCG